MIWRIAAEVSWIETAEVDPVRLRDRNGLSYCAREQIANAFIVADDGGFVAGEKAQDRGRHVDHELAPDGLTNVRRPGEI